MDVLETSRLGVKAEPEKTERNSASAPQAPESTQLRAILNLLATVVQQPTSAATSDAFVNALATQHDLSRVSLGWVVGRRVQVQTISHTIRFERRSDLVQSITRAMEECVDQRTTLLHTTHDVADRSQQILRQHATLAERSGADSVCSIPLTNDDGVYGVLTLERSGAKPLDTATATECEVALQMAGPYTHLLWREQRWLGGRAFDAVRRSLRSLLRPGRDGRKIAAVLLVAALAFVFLGKGNYRVSGRAYLEGLTQRAAVAPFDGYIGAATVRPGDLVEAGTVLCTLDRRELELELQQFSSEHEQLIKRKQRARAEGDAAQLRVLSAQLDQTKARRALVEYHLSQTEISSPIAGVVVSGDLSQAIGAPCARGDVLFQVAPLDQYRVVLEVDERDVAQLRQQQHGTLALAAFPGESLPFEVFSITPVSVPRDGRNFFRIEAQLTTTELDRLRPGMEGIGKVEIGPRRHIWIWTHDIVDWLRVRVWSWMP
ncbi:MAG: HlyD family efflux transporter periplasmic adaptor subunit [Planctomycetota bacterium]